MTLKLNNLSKSFGRKQVLTNFSYEFSNKGIYLISGDSGVGKTTLLRIIAGLDKSFSGEIIGGGISNVSFAFQEYRLFPNLTSLENVMTASKNESEAEFPEAKALLSDLGFTNEDMQLLPSELSGGMRQRVSLARAFLKKAPILLLDEPTKELDNSLCKVVQDIIKREATYRLVIMVSHKEDDVHELNATEIHL